MSQDTKLARRSLRAALGRALRPHFRLAFGFSLVINLLLLVSPIYMLQVYDRILTSGSLETLAWLTVAAFVLLAIYAIAEAARRRIFALAGLAIEKELTPRLFNGFSASDQDGRLLANDLSTVQRLQSMLQGGQFAWVFDAPFVPLFFVMMFLVHTWIGVLAIIGTLLLVGIAVAGQFSNRRQLEASEDSENALRNLTQGVVRQRSAIVAMGMGGKLLSRFKSARASADDLTLPAAQTDGQFAAISRGLRQTLQIAVLGFGAFLALRQEMSAGGIVAGSILMGRALAPIDQLVGNWRGFVSLATIWRETSRRAGASQEGTDIIPQPIDAHPNLELRSLGVSVPGSARALVKPFSATFESGSLIALVGDNGSGKTSLLQILSGAWAPPSGEVAFSGRDIHNWAHDDRGKWVGYLPQGVELLPGTVFENITRFSAEATVEDAETAVNLIGGASLIAGLPDGYDTPVGPGGIHLSAGQSQMIGLARAFFGDPKLLLLDEPTANLDANASLRVVSALQRLCQQGAIIVTSTHHIPLIRSCKNILGLRDGQAFLGVPSEFLKARPAAAPQSFVQTEMVG